MENITIRPLIAGDEGAVNEFFDAMGGESRALFNRHGGNQAGVLDFCEKQNTDRRRYWMAEDEDGRMAGLVFLWDLHTGIPWLGIAVSESMRGKRFGQVLIDVTKSWCHAHNKGGILLTTHMANYRAQSLYERCGFVRLGVSNQDNELLYLCKLSLQAVAAAQ